MASVTRAVRQIIAGDARPLLVVGLSTPGPVDRLTGLLINPPSMPGWEGFNMRAALGAVMNAQLFVDNDANTFALGALWRARQAHGPATPEHWLVTKLSASGIGAALITGGDLYRGA